MSGEKAVAERRSTRGKRAQISRFSPLLPVAVAAICCHHRPTLRGTGSGRRRMPGVKCLSRFHSTTGFHNSTVVLAEPFSTVRHTITPQKRQDDGSVRCLGENIEALARPLPPSVELTITIIATLASKRMRVPLLSTARSSARRMQSSATPIQQQLPEEHAWDSLTTRRRTEPSMNTRALRLALTDGISFEDVAPRSNASSPALSS